MADEGEGFAARWSRLKRARDEPRSGDAAAGAGPAAAAAAAPAAAAELPDETIDLPSIEDLTRESDFTGFMRKGVPVELKRQALRKLWRSDPVFANLDGLLEYGDDYGAPWKTGAAVRTLYRIGKGMVDSAEEIAESPADAPATPDAAEPRNAAVPAGDAAAAERPMPDGDEPDPTGKG
ncbi:MAG: DUF3306 domain-containing protein [Dongiaceae bacterium]